MADFDSSLPIRTEGAGDVIVKIADATVPSQQLVVESDGSINVNAAFSPGTEVIITDGTDTLEVNADGSLNITDNGGSLTVDATNLDIRDLVFATDKVDASGSTLGANSGVDIGDVTVNNAAGAAAVNIQDGGNSITVDGSVTVSATDLDIRDLVFATDSVDVSGSEVSLDATTLAALENITVSATDLDIRDLTHASDSVKIGDGTDFLAVNTDGSINVVVSNDVPGTEICNRQTSSSVAANASVNHDYTVTALTTFTAEAVQVAGSGKLKVQVLFNGVIKFDAFNSTANPTIFIPMYRMIKAAAGQVIRITITNFDNQAQDLYSTLMGSETP
jgi:hypothetical protein